MHDTEPHPHLVSPPFRGNQEDIRVTSKEHPMAHGYGITFPPDRVCQYPPAGKRKSQAGSKGDRQLLRTFMRHLANVGEVW